MFEFLGANTSWSILSLGDLLKLNKNSWITIDDLSTYKIAGVTSHGNGIEIKRSVMGTELTMKKYQKISENQLMWCKVDTKNGAFGITETHHQGSIASSNMCLADINTDICYPKFLQYFFRLPAVYNRLTALSIGTTNRQYLTPQELMKSVCLHVPLKDEQRRIVARIEEVASRIEEARELRRRAVYEADALKNKNAENLFSFNDRNCNMQSIGYICEVKGGIQKSSDRTPRANPRRYITVAHVQRNWIDVTDPRYFEVSDEELEKWRLIPGDVLVIEGNGSADQIGRAALFSGEIEDCVHQNHVIRIRPNQEVILPGYLNGFLNSPIGQKQIHERSRTTSGLFNLSVGRIKNIDVPLHSLKDQQRIMKSLQDMRRKLDALKRHQADTAAELDALLPAVLERAFRGEL